MWNPEKPLPGPDGQTRANGRLGVWQGRGPIRKDERGNARVGKKPRAPWNANGFLVVGRFVSVAALTFELQEKTRVSWPERFLGNQSPSSNSAGLSWTPRNLVADSRISGLQRASAYLLSDMLIRHASCCILARARPSSTSWRCATRGGACRGITIRGSSPAYKAL